MVLLAKKKKFISASPPVLNNNRNVQSIWSSVKRLLEPVMTKRFNIDGLHFPPLRERLVNTFIANPIKRKY